MLGTQGPTEGAAGVSRFGLMLSGLPFDFAVVWRRFHLGLFGRRYCHSWGEGGRSSRLSWVVAGSEPDRLNATERLLVFSSG